MTNCTMASLSTIVLLLFPLVSFYCANTVAVQGGVRLGGACTINTNCTTNVTNSECKNKTCQCVSTFYPQTENNTCQAKKALGVQCTENEEFSDVNATCTSTCKCKTSHYKDSTNSCKPRNAAVTMAIAEMSTIIMCFMLAYFEVLK
ncbi:uncharacterized protein LOC127709691 isoform X2 [Mytilus californianus]|uniref:uncharacterized protein LOC127709691 isoform X2 n=1 Tax=Mytilus californianus TaxID=6549 RepID=UPI002247E39D|nr:uncharacterized protein LOC127709691 isoform X2 [Mytilus californianus]